MRRRNVLQLGALAFGVPAAGKSCILIQLTGGPSQLDTWDLKPDAPSHIRGPFRPIRTNVAGIEISEIFPRMARCADRYAVVRSFTDDGEPTHEAWTLPGAGKTRSFCEAVRLIAAGTKYVTVRMFKSVFDEITWDAHGWAPFSTLAHYRDHVGPTFDRKYTALLEDLRRRGLIESTLVIAMGEFGRSPKINPSGGRDHWPRCQSILLAGRGIQGGQVIGSSDRIGAEPRGEPYTIERLRSLI